MPTWASSVSNTSMKPAASRSRPADERAVEPPVDGALGQPHGDDRADASDAAHSSAVSSTASAGDDPVDQPDGERFLGAHVPAAPHEVLGLRRADEAGDALRTAATREDAELDLGEPEPRRLRGHPQVTGQRELQSRRPVRTR